MTSSVGSSEFSWGSGLHPGRGQLSPLDELHGMYATDPQNPEANAEDVYLPGATQSGPDADGVYVPGTLRSGATPRVTAPQTTPREGAFAPIDPSKYNPGHDPEGMQDGAGKEWRDSIPPNPVV